MISPYNKDNLIPFVKELIQINSRMNFVATTGSYTALKGVLKTITSIEDFTGVRESPEGLVKTLHPKIFFGFLGNGAKPDHREFFNVIGSKPFDLLVSNLYPFWEIKDKNLTIEEMTYYWDIGGPSMIMAAIKGNHTIVLTDPADYESFIKALKHDSEENKKFFKKLNLKALQYVVTYHKMIGEYFEKDFNLL